MRKGYLLTALAAAVLLAASSGTAYAQITAEVAKEVAEGDSVTITFTAKAVIEPGDSAGSITVTVDHGADNTGASNETEDVVGNPGTALLTFPAGEAVGDGAENKVETVTGTAVLQTTQDPDAEDEDVVLEYTIAAVGGYSIPDGQQETPAPLDDPDNGAFTIADDETQTYVVALDEDETPTEGGTMDARSTFTATVKAVPKHVDDEAVLTLQLSDPVNYSWDTDANANTSANPITIGDTTANNTPATDAENMQEITITTPVNDGNRETDTITVTAYSGSAGRATMQGSVDIDVADIHALPDGMAVTAVAMDMDDMEVMEITEGGDAVNLMISVDRGKDKTAKTVEELTVSVEAAYSAQASDFRLSPTMVTLGMVEMADGAQAATVPLALSAVTDEDVGAEDLMLNLVLMGDEDNGPGSATGTFSIAIVDDTQKKIEPKATEADYDNIKSAIAAGAGDDEMLNPGETVTIMTSDLFTVAEGYTGSFGVSVEGDGGDRFGVG